MQIILFLGTHARHPSRTHEDDKSLQRFKQLCLVEIRWYIEGQRKTQGIWIIEVRVFQLLNSENSLRDFGE